MSASEKLKALEVGGPYENRAEGILKAVLPQIVAVVEAAERADEKRVSFTLNNQTVALVPLNESVDLARALTTLDEVLS